MVTTRDCCACATSMRAAGQSEEDALLQVAGRQRQAPPSVAGRGQTERERALHGRGGAGMARRMDRE